MKSGTINLTILIVISAGLLHSQPRAEVTEWKKSFGTVKQGDPVRFEYEVKNAGTQPLIFTSYEVECSCTTATLPAQPVLPGQTGTIAVAFKTDAAIGRQERDVRVLSNEPGGVKLRFKGSVEEKK